MHKALEVHCAVPPVSHPLEFPHPVWGATGCQHVGDVGALYG